MNGGLGDKPPPAAAEAGMLSRLSIRRKLVLIIMLVCSVATLLAGVALVSYQLLAFRKSMESDLLGQARMIALNCLAPIEFDYPEEAEEVLHSLQAIPAIEVACLYRKNGSVFTMYTREGVSRVDPPEPREDSGPKVIGSHMVLFKQLYSDDDMFVGTLYLRSDLNELAVFRKRGALVLGMVMLLSSVVGLFLATRLQRLISSPVTALAETARQVAQQEDYSLRAHKQSEDELGLLTVAFNDMLAKVQSRDATLRQLRNQLSNIINSMPSVLVGVDRDGRVIQWNREAERITGASAAEAEGRMLAEVFPELAGDLSKVRLAMIDGGPQKEEKVVRIIDGERRFHDVTVYSLKDMDGAVIRVDDVTDRVQIEEMMIQSEKMLSVGGLAAGMAHEINNPLAGIIQNVQVMRNRLSRGLARNRQAAEQSGTTIEAIESYMEQRGIRSMIESIMVSGRRAAKIVENMLSFSRKGDSQLRPYDLAELLDKTVELASNDYDLKKKYDFRKIKISREYDPATPSVPCEATKIQQVFLNLLKNSAHAMVAEHSFEQSSGDSQPPMFILRLRPDGQQVRVEVEDNGPGMDEITRKRVFEPFFTTKDTGIGTGLGLSVSYFIITENHGGTMAVESAPGQGTKFIIHLPVERAVS
jgi:PAS domain S-box-containing protein